MKYTTEEIKGLLEGITPGEWEYGSDSELVYTGCDGAGLVIGRARELVDRKFIAAAPTIIRDLLAEVERLREDIEQLRVQLAACGVAAMCNTKQSRGQQKCVVGDYGWSQSYQDVVNAVGREIALRDQLQAAQALAATHLADQELLVARERKRVARKCAEMCEPWGVADRIRTRYGVEE